MILYPTEAPSASSHRALNSAVECHLHTVEVVGSNPTAPTIQIKLSSRLRSPDMPAKFEIDKPGRLVRSSAWGKLTLADLRDHREALLGHPDFNPDYDQLIDFSEVTFVELTGAQIHSATLDTVFSSKSRRALIAPAPTVFGLARMYETYYSMLDNPANLRVFRDKSSALKWLEEREG